MIRAAALYVMPDGPYAARADVDLWDEARDARLYAGQWPVVAHPPCQRWGRWWWKGPAGTRYPRPGMDGGLFAAALAALDRWGGVLEHPAGSLAWPAHGLAPPTGDGWSRDLWGRWTCEVDQGHYGHRARKPTWLVYVGASEPAPLTWGPSAHAETVGEIAARGVKGRQSSCTVLSKRARTLTPPAFAEVLVSLAAHSAGRA
tara:strand:- start:39 stop:644 length:606 start_codon:yes stop_codon:yes gene_type:complete